MQRTLFLGNERTLRETCIMSVFKFIKYEKAKSHKLHSLLRKKKSINKKIRFFFSFLFIFTGNEVPKFGQSSGNYMK